MRELKFRIWDKQNKTWLKNSSSLHYFSNWSICPFTGKLIDYVGVIDGDHGDKYTASPAPDYYMQDGKIVKDSRYVIQQYIGMKDCNNIEIYEGDIVTYQQPYRASRLTHPATTDSYRTIIAPVIYNEDSFQFEIDSYEISTPMIKTRKDLEIIGNIFQNIDLMKKS